MISNRADPQPVEDANSSPSSGAGSQVNREPVFLAVGKLRRPHGLHGEIIMDVLTDFPERLHPGMTLYAGPQYQPLRLHSLRKHGAVLLVAFDGYETPETIGTWRNHLTYVTAADRPPLPEGEYYHHQVIGLKVIGEQGELVGWITEILAAGANDIFVVRPETGKEILIPAVDDFVLAVDLQNGQIRVRLAPGLLPE